MARAGFAVGVVVGAAMVLFGFAALGLHADEASAEVLEAAAAAHVDPVRLQGAVNSLEADGLDADPWTYLRGVGELDSPTSSPPRSAPGSRVNCIIARESRGNASAVNPRSGAAGLGQFLSSTWKTTPQGQAGASVFDPAANRAAIQFMLDAGRGREFDAVRFYGC